MLVRRVLLAPALVVVGAACRPLPTAAPSKAPIVGLVGQGVRVHVAEIGEPGAALQVRRLDAHEDERYATVCFSPCDAPSSTWRFQQPEVEPHRYRIAPRSGEAFPPSHDFLLPSSGDVTLRLEAGSTVRKRVGQALTVGGMASVGFWWTTAVVSGGPTSADSCRWPSCPQGPNPVQTASLVALGVSAGAILVGLPLWVTGRTRVTDDAGERIGSRRAVRAFDGSPTRFVF